LQGAISSYLKEYDDDDYALEVKTWFKAVSSLEALYKDIRHTFQRITIVEGRNIDERQCENI
jgi:hypothetical protein